MAVDLFAGIPVTEYTAALAWYQRLLGAAPTFVASDTEAVWEPGLIGLAGRPWGADA